MRLHLQNALQLLTQVIAMAIDQVQDPGSRLWERRSRRKSLSVSTAPASCSPDDSLHESYELLKVLGRGSVGVVYRARRRRDDRQVVVKVREVLDSEMSRSCRDEFEVLKSLDHPHIIHALELLEQAARSVLVFDFCCEDTLQTVVRLSYPHGLPSEPTLLGLGSCAECGQS